VSDLRVQADLVVATMQLNLVRLLRQAMRTADLAAGAEARDCFVPCADPLHRRLFCHRLLCEERFERRLVIHPEPLYERRPVIHPTPRVEQMMLECPAPTMPPPAKTPNPIQPPWAVLPWPKCSSQPRQPVKLHRCHTDVVNRGTMLDLFV
jgi:hypothetical protein